MKIYNLIDNNFNYIVRIYINELYKLKKYFNVNQTNIIYTIPDHKVLMITSKFGITAIKESNNKKRKYYIVSNDFNEILSIKCSS